MRRPSDMADHPIEIKPRQVGFPQNGLQVRFDLTTQAQPVDDPAGFRPCRGGGNVIGSGSYFPETCR